MYEIQIGRVNEDSKLTGTSKVGRTPFLFPFFSFFFLNNSLPNSIELGIDQFTLENCQWSSKNPCSSPSQKHEEKLNNNKTY